MAARRTLASSVQRRVLAPADLPSPCASGDPARTIADPKIAHADEAAGLFSTLMGDSVEGRREFIQTHALEAINLDV